jgi:hypothetical protein
MSKQKNHIKLEKVSKGRWHGECMLYIEIQDIGQEYDVKFVMY